MNQILIVLGGIVLCVLYVSVVLFATAGCNGNCSQGRRPCDCKRGPDA